MSGGAAGGTSAASGAAAGGGTLGGAAGGGPSARLRVAVFGLTPTSIHYLTYVRFLASRGHYVTCLTNAPRVDAPVRVVDFTRYRALAARLPRGVRMLPKLAIMTECLLNRRFDVLDIMQVTPDGVLAALIWRGPLVLDFWGSDVLRLDQRPWWVRWLMPRVLAKAGAIHSVSQQMTTELVRLGARPARIETFQYGIDVGFFAPAPAAPGTDAGPDAHLHEAPAGKVILSTRGLRSFYRIETIVRALPHVLAREPEARLELTGADDVETPRLQALAAELGVGERVAFLGFVTREELAEHLRAACVWVSVPPSDGAPLSLLEAMAAGALPVVADIPSMREWLGESRGVLIAEVTPEGVAAAILDGFARAADAAVAAANRRLVEERADSAANLPRWEGLLARTAQAGARARRRAHLTGGGATT